MDDLVVEQRTAEHLALACVLRRLVDQPLHADHGGDRAPQPLLLELLHLVDEAHAFLADQVPHRYLHFVEEDLRGVRRAHAELVELLHDLNAGRLHRQTDQRLVLVDWPSPRIGQQAHPVGLRAVGRPHLAAVDHIVAADAARGRLERRDIGTGTDFRDAEAGHVVTRNRRRQELAPQLVAAVAGEGGRRHVGLHADRHRHRAALDGAQLLRHDHGVGVVEPHAAILDRLVDAEQACVAEPLEHFVRGKDSVFLPLRDVRVDILVDDCPQGAADLGMFLGELHVSDSPISAWCPSASR